MTDRVCVCAVWRFFYAVIVNKILLLTVGRLPIADVEWRSWPFKMLTSLSLLVLSCQCVRERKSRHLQKCHAHLNKWYLKHGPQIFSQVDFDCNYLKERHNLI